MSAVLVPENEQSKEQTNSKKKSRNPELGIHADPNFDKTLENLDKKTSKRKKKKLKSPELGIHGDADFEKTLEELDDDDFVNNLDILDKTIEEARNTCENKNAEKNVKEGSSKENSPNKEKKYPEKSKLTVKDSTPEVSKTNRKRQRSDTEGSIFNYNILWYI